MCNQINLSEKELVKKVILRAKVIGKKYPKEELGDMISDGWVGMHDALGRFDPTMGKFSTYSEFRIDGAIIDGIRERKRFYCISKKWDKINNDCNDQENHQYQIQCVQTVEPWTLAYRPYFYGDDVESTSDPTDKFTQFTNRQLISDRDEKLIALRKQGKKLSELSEIFNVSVSRIGQILKKNSMLLRQVKRGKSAI